MEHHDRQLVDEISKSKKMMKHKEDNFSSVQDYMKGKSVQNCRMAFGIRFELVKDIKGNFKDMHRRKGGEEGLVCEDCDNKEIKTQSHTSKIDDLVVFFQKLMRERLRGKTGS